MSIPIDVTKKLALNSIKKLSQQFRKTYGFDSGVFLFGSGRSGTTWLQELIIQQSQFYKSFEPFRFYQDKINFHKKDKESYLTLQKIMSGTEKRSVKYLIKNKRILHEYSSKNILIKSIRSHFFMKWIYDKYKLEYKFIYIIRNPGSVALSQIKLNWNIDKKLNRLKKNSIESNNDPIFNKLNQIISKLKNTNVITTLKHPVLKLL